MGIVIEQLAPEPYSELLPNGDGAQAVQIVESEFEPLDAFLDVRRRIGPWYGCMPNGIGLYEQSAVPHLIGLLSSPRDSVLAAVEINQLSPNIVKFWCAQDFDAPASCGENPICKPGLSYDDDDLDYHACRIRHLQDRRKRFSKRVE